MRKLYMTAGSPFARAVRIVLVEKGLDFERIVSPSLCERADATPTLQVPTLIDDDVRLWDSAVILEYLMSTYPNASQSYEASAFATDYVRSGHQLRDKLVHATVQTFGVSTTTISQCHWTGMMHADNAHLTRCALRNQHLLDWFENELIDEHNGFVAGLDSVQDMLLVCICQFIERRPLNLTWDAPRRPKMRALADRLSRRPSFDAEPALWWEPGMDLTDPEQLAWASRVTIADGIDFPAWKASRA
ncbi:MAG: glutathione S-transferase [Hyphomicrobiales bacterium]|nr:MAG: glutathione S-transferase [Hyphomicrobiales bacterium]